MILLPIKQKLEDNPQFTSHPDCQESIYKSVEFYENIGYHIPWIGYYASSNDQLVGTAGFKGKPVNGRVEIAYGTFPAHRHKGIGAEICRQLVMLARATNPSITIFARTLPEENHSTSILKKNGFLYKGVVYDPEDGEVWEWEYVPLFSEQ
ncbi:MAG: family N-acetyltransferase [Flavipsychrobacter sp.]|jgi:RimJ/RimL family protein N-acetyltransferase|nr:family N-acetyltransferase [Flavipsychrobacter sp.]